MHFLLALLGMAFGAGLLLMLRELRHAPEGFQDQEGFHESNKAESREVLEAVDAMHSHAA